MKFEFNGQEFDTDKRIFVLGYTITKNWFPFDGEQPHCINNIQYYSPVVKSFFVESLVFGVRETEGRKKNMVVGLKLDFNKPAFNNSIGKGYIIGHSSKECLDKFQKLTYNN